MKILTARQQEVFDLIKNRIDLTGMPPTRAEIAKELGFRSANAAEDHIKALARKGVVEIVSGTSRGLRIVRNQIESHDDNLNSLPLVGQVAAGEPILSQEHIENYYHIDPSMFRPLADFLLRVKGDSMKDVGIIDGDLLVVHKTQVAQNGQVVVARIDDEVTVKRFEKKNNLVYLYPENTEFTAIQVDLKTQHFAIEGLAVGVIRSKF